MRIDVSIGVRIDDLPSKGIVRPYSGKSRFKFGSECVMLICEKFKGVQVFQ